MQRCKNENENQKPKTENQKQKTEKKTYTIYNLFKNASKNIK
jgi:hypothetical protein